MKYPILLRDLQKYIREYGINCSDKITATELRRLGFTRTETDKIFGNDDTDYLKLELPLLFVLAKRLDIDPLWILVETPEFEELFPVIEEEFWPNFEDNPLDDISRYPALKSRSRHRVAFDPNSYTSCLLEPASSELIKGYASALAETNIKEIMDAELLDFVRADIKKAKRHTKELLAYHEGPGSWSIEKRNCNIWLSKVPTDIFLNNKEFLKNLEKDIDDIWNAVLNSRVIREDNLDGLFGRIEAEIYLKEKVLEIHNPDITLFYKYLERPIKVSEFALENSGSTNLNAYINKKYEYEFVPSFAQNVFIVAPKNCEAVIFKYRDKILESYSFDMEGGEKPQFSKYTWSDYCVEEPES